MKKVVKELRVSERLEVSNVTILRKTPTRIFLEGDTIG